MIELLLPYYLQVKSACKWEYVTKFLHVTLLNVMHTVEPLCSKHALWRTPLYSGHLFQEQIMFSYGLTLVF